MMVRTQIMLDAEQHRLAKQRAAELGISLAEYVREAIAKENAEAAPPGDISRIFGLGRGGPPDVAHNKDAYLAESYRREFERKRDSRKKSAG